MLRGTVMWRLPTSLLAGLLMAAAVVGCGDDDESTAQDRVKVAAASEPEDVFIRRMAKLLETTTAKKDCAQLDEINARSFTRFPCPPDKRLRKSMAGFEVVDAQTYDTGAVIDYRSGTASDGAAILLFVTPDRNWGISRFGLLTKPSVDTSDHSSRAGYRQAVGDYLEAVRERDCEAFEKVALTDRNVELKEVCDTSFANTEPLAKRLKANPSARAAYEGGNGTYGFFTLETQRPEPRNVTISVMRMAARGADSYLVLDATPSPTAAELRRLREEFREQKDRGGPATMEPSSKPSDPAVTP